MSIVKWVLLCVLVYLVMLLAYLPASQVLTRLNLPKDIQMNGLSGSIWQGRAEQALLHGLPVTKLSWELSVLPLIWGTVSADVDAGRIRQSDEISFKGHLAFSKSTFEAQDFQAYLPTNLVMSLLPLPFPVHADGRLRLQLDELSYDNGCETLLGQGQWLNAQIVAPNKVIEMGNFDLQLRCEQQNVVGEIKEPNSLGLNTLAILLPDFKYNIEGRFKPAADLPKEVHQATQFFNGPDAEGYYAIKF